VVGAVREFRRHTDTPIALVKVARPAAYSQSCANAPSGTNDAAGRVLLTLVFNL
jgi:hypothetical protein